MTQSTYLKARTASLATSGQPPVAGTTIPVTSGLTGAYLHSGGLAYLGRNYATWEDDATVIGAPVESGRALRFGVGSGIQTPVAETAAATLIFIGQKPDAGTPAFFMGCRGATGNLGISIYAPSTTLVLGVQVASGEVQAGLAMEDGWNLYMATVPATGGLYALMNRTQNTTNVSVSTADRQVTGSDSYKIGDFAGSWDALMLGALIFNRVLTTGELEAMEVWARAYAADFGITV